MRDRYILAVDCGTQSLRAMIFALNGEMVARVKECYLPCVSPGPGLAEQDPDIYWHSLETACRQLKQTVPQVFDRVIGIGVATLRNTLVNLDRQGRVLRPAITWMDQRRADPGAGPDKVLRLVYALPLLGNILKETQALGKCNWIMQHQPEIWERTHKYVQVSGFCTTGSQENSPMPWHARSDTSPLITNATVGPKDGSICQRSCSRYPWKTAPACAGRGGDRQGVKAASDATGIASGIR